MEEKTKVKVKKEVKVKTTKYYICDDCGCKEEVDESEGYQSHGLCWDCYVSEEWGTCED